ncbi:MAG: glutathione S-transferase [Rhizobiaceae bacterium]|nr:glutathione S-transferase [Rhizobiaceae bacterium]
MLLYDGGRAPNPRRVQIFLAEKNIEIEKVQVDINALDQKSDEFTKMNPMQRLPVLMLGDGTAISESVAICRYFEEIQPDPPLMGINAKDKAIVEMWQRRMELNLMLPIAQAFRHLHPGAAHLEGTQIAEWGEINKPRAIECMKILDAELGTREFIAGEQFTIADITGIVACQFLKPARIEIPEDMENLSRWFKEMCSRPSVMG